MSIQSFRSLSRQPEARAVSRAWILQSHDIKKMATSLSIIAAGIVDLRRMFPDEKARNGNAWQACATTSPAKRGPITGAPFSYLNKAGRDDLDHISICWSPSSAHNATIGASSSFNSSSAFPRGVSHG